MKRECAQCEWCGIEKTLDRAVVTVKFECCHDEYYVHFHTGKCPLLQQDADMELFVVAGEVLH